jgi:hypothetical protein
MECEVLTDSGQTIQTTVDTVTQNQQAVECEVVTDSGQTLQENSGHSDTEPTDGKLRGTDRQWTDPTRQRCTAPQTRFSKFCYCHRTIYSNLLCELQNCSLPSALSTSFSYQLPTADWLRFPKCYNLTQNRHSITIHLHKSNI